MKSKLNLGRSIINPLKAEQSKYMNRPVTYKKRFAWVQKHIIDERNELNKLSRAINIVHYFEQKL